MEFGDYYLILLGAALAFVSVIEIMIIRNENAGHYDRWPNTWLGTPAWWEVPPAP